MNIELLHKIHDLKILVLGDFMIDKYIDGNVSRISPEAPVPVLEVKSKKSKLGGAGNVVNNLTMLGAKVRIVGCIGSDEDGNWLKEQLSEWGSDTEYLMQNSKVKTLQKQDWYQKSNSF